ncbi:MAG: DM13 domain-containing protein [Paracoccaceae bacterium]
MIRLTNTLRAALISTATLFSLPAFAQTFGPFTGENGHVTAGTASIVEDGGKYYVQLNADFSFDGAPDPKLALGNGTVDTATTMANLASNTGEQRYELPAGIDPAAYTTLHVWCDQFTVSLGIAPVN